MLTPVLNRIEDLKIFDPVVGLISVFMVDVFVLPKFSVEVLLHHPTVFLVLDSVAFDLCVSRCNGIDTGLCCATT